MEENNSKGKVFIIKIIIFLFLSAVLFSSMFFSKNIEILLNNASFLYSKEVLNSNFKIHYIDVGQGDCSFIEIGDISIMIDTGPEESAQDVIKYLRYLGYNTNDIIDYLILTHTDLDHIGSACKILEKYQVKNIYIPKVYSTFDIEIGNATEDYYISYSSLWERTIEAIYSEIGIVNVKYSYVDESFGNENFYFSFFTPLEEKAETLNDYSPIIMLNVQGMKFIFVGDCSANIENEFLNYYDVLVQNNFFDCDVLKVGHHGSKSSTSLAFLQALNPEIAVISCSIDNSYNHPSNEVVNRLNTMDCNTLRTDTMGSIMIYEINSNIKVKNDFDFIGNIYFEWKYFVFGIEILIVFFLFGIKIKKI